MIKSIVKWWRVNNELVNKLHPIGRSHVSQLWNHMDVATSDGESYIWNVLIKWKTKFKFHFKIKSNLIKGWEGNSKWISLEVLINKDSLEKRKGSRVRRRKPCQYSAKKKNCSKIQEEHSCPSKSKGYFCFFKSKVGDASPIFIQLSPRSNQQPSTLSQAFPTTCSSEIFRHHSRSSFIALGSWSVTKIESEEFIVFFIVKDHLEICTCFHTYKYKLIICYTISWLGDSSIRNLCLQSLFSISSTM